MGLNIRYGIALGSNLGDRLANLQRGVSEVLARVEGAALVAAAPVYETKPVDCPPGSLSFYNSVVEIDSPLAPHAMHRVLQAVERLMGRPDDRERNAPRPLDLDILYAGDLRLDDDVLTVPHPRLHQRRFVLQPLADIQPELVLPGQRRSVAELLATLEEAAGEVRRVTVDWMGATSSTKCVLNPAHDPLTIWASYGHGANGDLEDFIVGSRSGLQRLKELIEKAIEEGEAFSFDEKGIQFNGVKRIDTENPDPPSEHWAAPLLGWGCFLVVLATLILALFGLASLLDR